MIQDYIKSHDVQEDTSHNQWEDQLFEQSLEIEPRDQQPKKAVSKQHCHCQLSLSPPLSPPSLYSLENTRWTYAHPVLIQALWLTF